MGEVSRTRRNMRYGQAHEIGAQMREQRRAAGISLRVMAEKLGRPKSSLSDAENGVVMPSQKLLESYEDILALPAGTLLNHGAPSTSIIETTTPFKLRAARDADELVPRVDIPLGPEIINDEIECREIAISLLLEKQDDHSGQPREIVFMMADPPPHLSDDLRQRWFSALARALRQGDHITHIWTPPNALEESQIMLRNLVNLIDLANKSGGQYTVLYLPDTFASALPHELFVIPNRAAIQFFSKFQSSHSDSALFYPKGEKNSAYIQHFRSYFAMLRVIAQQVLRTYPIYNSADFDRVILEAEQKDGEEILVVEPVSDKSIPAAVRLARMQRILREENDPGTEDWLREEFAIIEQRRSRFEERARRWPIRHILYRQVLENMVHAQSFRDNKADKFGTSANLWPEEIRACIQQLLTDLQNFSNYEVGLKADPLPEEPQTYWEVVADQCLFVFVEPAETLLHVSTQQKRIVQLQKNYFAYLWDRIPAADKKKSEVIAFLKGLIGET
jgi:transcriptional regulator with XRE-family HTH domain